MIISTNVSVAVPGTVEVCDIMEDSGGEISGVTTEGSVFPKVKQWALQN